MAKALRKKATETPEEFEARKAEVANSDSSRIDALEQGMVQMLQGMNGIVEKLNEKDVEPLPEKVIHREVIDLPSATINVGEVELRRDLANFLQERVDNLVETGERPGWTISKEIEHIIKYIKKTATTSMAAAASRQTTINGERI